MKKTIKEFWISYYKNVIPKDAPDTQIKESRRAFYAGAAAMFQAINILAPEDEPTLEDIQHVDNLNKELLEFADEVKQGLR